MDAPAEPELDADTIRHCRRVLLSVVDMAHAVAQEMQRRVTAPQDAPAEDPPLAAAAAFDRACRNIRQTVMLVEDFGKGKTPRSRAGEHRIAARKRIIREVEDVIQRSASGPRSERLYRELRERLELPDLEEELEHRQVAEIVTDLCRDLGIAHAEGTHPWKRRTPADIVALCARAARPARRSSGAASAAGPIGPTDGWTRSDPGGGATDSRATDSPPPDRLAGDGLEAPNVDDAELNAPDQDVGALDAQHLDAQHLGAPHLDAPDLDVRDLDAPDPDVPDPDVPDFCDYEPGARAWVLPQRVTPRPAAPDITRPNGTASFRGG